MVCITSIEAMLEKGERDIALGRSVTYEPGLMQKISEQGKAAALSGKSVKFGFSFKR